MSKSPSLRRIQADIRELALDPSDQYYAAPLENDMFEWHFTIRGAEGTDFEGGIYHGRILLPAEYPFKPPHIMFLTPSGRFQTNTKICLSFSAYHPELWQPAWGIRLILEALISFLPTPGDGAIGALDYSSAERKRLALESQKFCCPQCGPIVKLLPKLQRKQNDGEEESKKKKQSPFAMQIAELRRMQQVNHEAKNNPTKKKADDTNKSAGVDGEDETNTTNTKTETGTNTTKPTNTATAANKDKSSEPSVAIGNDNSMINSTNTNTAPTSCCSSGDCIETDDTGKSIKASNDDDGTKHESNNNNLADTGTDTDTDDAVTNNSNDDAVNIVDENETNNTNNNSTRNLSWMYHPLLNVSIILMFMICVLFAKKGYDLSKELQQIQELPPIVSTPPSPLDNTDVNPPPDSAPPSTTTFSGDAASSSSSSEL